MIIPKIEISEISLIKIHHVILYKTFEDLAKDIIKSAMTNHGVGMILNWAEGMAFTIGFFPDTERVTNESLDGVSHWRHLMIAPKEKFEERVNLAGGDILLSDRTIDSVITTAIRKVKEVYKIE